MRAANRGYMGRIWQGFGETGRVGCPTGVRQVQLGPFAFNYVPFRYAKNRQPKMKQALNGRS